MSVSCASGSTESFTNARGHEGTCRRIYCFGGKSADAQRLTAVEAFDPREGVWKRAGHMQHPRSSFGCVEYHGCVLVIGGNDKDAVPVKSVSRFDPLMERWQECAPLPSESSGLGACSVDWI
jgi:N-acetylneuraminic acid mutarotase